MGADKAIRIDPGDLDLDPFALSTVLAEVIKGIPFDLVMTGVQADDLNDGAVGLMLAEQLGVARAAVVTSIEPDEGGATILSGSISKALITTAVGLIIAIPAIAVYYIIKNRLMRITSLIEIALEDLITTVFLKKDIPMEGPANETETSQSQE